MSIFEENGIVVDGNELLSKDIHPDVPMKGIYFRELLENSDKSSGMNYD